MKIVLFLLLAVLLLAVKGAPVSAQPPLTPEETTLSAKEHEAALSPVYVYRKYISPAIGGSCPMTPSCSGYCIHAVKKHGLLMGWIMTCDRLMRCGRDEVKHAPVINTRSGQRYHDPVSENDFWRE